MSVARYFVRDANRRAEIDEYLSKQLKRAGYSRFEMAKSPLGTRVVIYAAKPGLVIGRRGESIKDLTKHLEARFGVENPQLSVAALESPELDPRVMASQVVMALEKGIHFRRACFWALQRIIEAGARGVEITLRGKLTTERSRYEKYRQGYLPKVGEPAQRNVKVAVTDVQLRQGLFGVQVKILPSTGDFPDKVTLIEIPESTEPQQEENLASPEKT